MYIGNDLQIAHPSYKIIDDISSGFNGSTTSFALQVSGATPVPFPISTQQVMISVNGVVQEPDPTGSAGFKLLGSNIVFSSAPANGHAFFGVINAGADYVTAGSEFPDGSATAPSFTFQDDQDTGWFRSGSGAVGYSANGAQTLTFDGNGLTVTGDASFVGDSAKNLLWDKSDGQLEFADNAKAMFGTGNDFYIASTGTGAKLHANNGVLELEGDSVQIWNANQNEAMAKFLADGAVELYHNAVKKAETGSGGLIVQGQVSVVGSGVSFSAADSGKAAFGDGDDLQIYHNGSHSIMSNATGQFHIKGDHIELQGNTAAEYLLRAIKDGAVELFYDNVKTLETLSTGIKLTNGAGANNTPAKLQLHNEDVSIVAGDHIGEIRFTGRDQAGAGTQAVGALIDATAAYDWNTSSSGYHATNIDFHTQDNSGTDTVASGPRMRIDSLGRVWIRNDSGYGPSADADDLIVGARDSGVNYGITILNHTGSDARLNFADTAHDSAGVIRYDHSNGSMQFNTETNLALTLDSSQNATFAGTVSDSKGNLRSIPSRSVGSVTLATSDVGKAILATGTVTVPNSTFSAGDAVTIINNSGSDITISKSISTMYLASDGSSANRTLATRGMATIWFASGTVAYISGAGLS